MSYWVYENWQIAGGKARIHRGSCSHCNNGEGTHDCPNDGINGKWHGPFATLQQAEKTAEGTGRPVSKCTFCL